MKKNIFGFTLIELIVTVTVIMVLSGMGVMSLNNFNSTKELESVRQEVSNHLKQARNLAITKQLPNKAYNLDYVKVNFSENTTITIAGVEGVNVFTASPYSAMTVRSGIAVSSSSNFGFFKSTGQLVDNSGVATTMSVVVQIAGVGGIKTININNWGIISNGN